MASNDYEVHPEEWDTTINDISASQKLMEDSCDQMRDIVRNSLVGAGMTGDVADQLADAYDREVLSSARKFDATVSDQIQLNKDNLDSYNSLQDTLSGIANR